MENNSAAPSVAGWHDDPEDPKFMRYSNGRTWAGERVPKDRSLILEASKGYRPGGASAGYRPGGAAAAQEEKAEVPEQLPYQPMTRRERRALEEAKHGISRNQTVEITDDFEFQSAAPKTVSYAPVVTPSIFEEFGAPESIEVPDFEDTQALVVHEKKELSWEDDFEAALSEDVEEEKEDNAEAEEQALPSLFGTSEDSPAPAPLSFDAEDDIEDEDDAPSALPTLNFGGDDEENDLPSVIVLEEPQDEPQDQPKTAEVEDEFFAEYENLMEGDEDDKDEESAQDHVGEEDDFSSVPALPVAAAPSYAAPAPSYAVAKPEPKKEEPSEEKPEPKPEPELSLEDILGEYPEEQSSAPSYAAPKLPVSEKVESDEAEDKDEAEVVASKPVEPEATTKAIASVKEPESKDEDSDEDEQPVFGFKSKLNNNFTNGSGNAHATAMEGVSAPAPVHVEADPKADDVDDDEDDDDESEDQESRKGFGSKLKSLFGRGRSKDVLDEDEDDSDEDDESEEDEKKSEASEPVKQVEEELETEAAKPAPVLPAESSKNDREEDDDQDDDNDDDDEKRQGHDDDNDADDEQDRDEDDEDEGVEREEPQLRAGLFSSRKAKEDAAVEVELLDRLTELAGRVAALKKEESDALARIEKAKADEAELAERINHAHEEHELLDHLAKTRQKELEITHADKEDDHFRDFLETHEQPADTDPEPEDDEITISAPASEQDQDDEDDEPETSRLPELKLN